MFAAARSIAAAAAASAVVLASEDDSAVYVPATVMPAPSHPSGCPGGRPAALAEPAAAERSDRMAGACRPLAVALERWEHAVGQLPGITLSQGMLMVSRYRADD
jgi:hypothetical protein